MKTMMPLINSELQRLLEDSCHFRLEVRINDKNEVDFLMIDNNTQVEKPMASGSGYERTIASLALRAVLSKICSLPRANVGGLMRSLERYPTITWRWFRSSLRRLKNTLRRYL
jgi:hypothetical protein